MKQTPYEPPDADFPGRLHDYELRRIEDNPQPGDAARLLEHARGLQDLVTELRDDNVWLFGLVAGEQNGAYADGEGPEDYADLPPAASAEIDW